MDYLRARTPVGGFLFVTVTQLAMVWWAYQQRFIQLKDLRVWFAALELVARRCGLGDHQRPHYGFEELRKLVAGRGGERASVARLEQVGLLLWDSAHITFAQTPSATSQVSLRCCRAFKTIGGKSRSRAKLSASSPRRQSAASLPPSLAISSVPSTTARTSA